MTGYIARRVRFRNGERTSLLLRRATGLPVHEVALFVGMCYRTRGRSAATIHQVVRSLGLLYSEFDAAGIQLLERVKEGRFLFIPEVYRLAAAAQCRLDDVDEERGGANTSSAVAGNLVNLERLRLRHKSAGERRPVDVATIATRLRHFHAFLTFLVGYVAVGLSREQADALESDAMRVLTALSAQVPKVSKRAKLGARMGLRKEEEQRLLDTVRPGSPANPWKSEFVAKRNWLIVVLLLATGMRRGELLGLQLKDIHPSRPTFQIVRRADSTSDPRRKQPNTKTYDREIELSPVLMRALWSYINKDRYAIKAARKVHQVIVSDEGAPLSEDSIDKLFASLRAACPGLPVQLTSHVMRHTWNDRFSEQAEEMGLSAEIEQKARANQQGWSEQSAMPMVYSKRFNERKGREVALRMQEVLEEKTRVGN